MAIWARCLRRFSWTATSASPRFISVPPSRNEFERIIRALLGLAENNPSSNLKQNQR